MNEPKVKLKPMIMDALVDLVIQDIKTAKNPIPLPLVHLAEKCRVIYKMNEKTYLNDGIDYSELTGDKHISDIENAINKLRALEVIMESVINPNKEVGGRIFRWFYPPVDGDACILLTEFCDSILSLTEIPKTSIKIRLEEGVIGIRPLEEE